MRTENTTPKASTAELRVASPAEIARIIEDARRLRAETQAALLRSAGRGLARLGRALLAPLAASRSARSGAEEA